MDVLIAEDDAPSRLMLQAMLTSWGYDVTVADDGDEAWGKLCEAEHPQLVILDWMMPGMEGPEIVRRLRERGSENPYYAIILTTRSSKDSAASALDSGADDFIEKPFNNDELRARIGVGSRMTALQQALSSHLQELRETLARINRLEGIIPICMHCKKIRDDQNGWNQLEKYLSDHSEAKFSHGICPHCYDEQLEMINNFRVT